MSTIPNILIWSIPLLPLGGFLINGTIGRRLPRSGVSLVALLSTAASAAIVAYLWAMMLRAGAPASFEISSRPWIAITGFQVQIAFLIDHLTLIMLGVVTGVGFLIHLYSVQYMAHEDGFWRFFAYLNLFMFFMLVLVLANSFLLMFVGWEGVGLASYLLIGFYFKKASAANAGRKAFVVNRIGDFGFLLAMFLLIVHFGSLDFGSIFTSISQHPEWNGGFLTTIALLLVLGATGKSAQIPLYVWLPDAMEGPTPVSALIHAATMVTAGVYMIARSHVLFDRSPAALTTIAIIGTATAFFAACVGMVQHDIKRVLAYSTISQLGYMFLGCAVAAYSAGIFHLLTHAFFKALLFLAAGSVIHALSGEQDMRKMGGLRRRIPITFWTMTMGVFAISGIPPWAGFFSKDEILYQTFVSTIPFHTLFWAVGLITAAITSFYMFRLWFKTFFNEPRFEDHPAVAHRSNEHVGEDEHDEGQSAHPHAVHESPAMMLIPLVLLAILSVVGGWVGVPRALFGNNQIEHFLEPVFAGTSNPSLLQAAQQGRSATELGLACVSVLVAFAGFAFAYVLYLRKPGTATVLAQRAKRVYAALENKFWVDEIYDSLLVTPILMFSRGILDLVFENGVITGSSSASGALTRGFSWITRRQISGNIRSYAGWLAVGAAAVLAIMIFGRSLWGYR